MILNKYLDINPEVAEALAAGKPVVALESTIISHGMPYPQNVETALNVERIIRENGAVPATIAIIGGRLKAGLNLKEIEYLAKEGMLFFEMCRILREKQPKCFIAENVKGILTANKRSAFPLILKE